MGAASPLSLSSYRALVIAEVKDAGEKLINPDDYDQSILDAVKEYSVDVDNILSAEVVGAGNRYTPLNFTGWVEGFSRITDIDVGAKPAPTLPSLPVDADPMWLEISKDVEYRYIGSQRYIFTPYFAPASTDRWRIYFTAPHTITGLDGATATTILPQHTRGIVSLSASYCCLKLSVLYADMQELNQFNADIVDYRNRSDIFSSRSKTLRSNYDQVIGQLTDTSPASVAGKFQTRFQWDRPFLTHKFRGGA